MENSTENHPENTGQTAQQEIVEALDIFYTNVFKTLEVLLGHHKSFGNWSFGGGVPPLKPLPTQKELGLWYAEGALTGFKEPAAISIALLPNECRVGLFLPNESLMHESLDKTLDSEITEVYGKNVPGVHIAVRKNEERTLFDHTLKEPPFDIVSMSKAMEYDHLKPGNLESAIYFGCLVQRLGYMVTTIWTGAIRAIYANGRTGLGTWLVFLEIGERILPHHMHGITNGYVLRSYQLGMQTVVEIRSSDHEEKIKSCLTGHGLHVQGIQKVMET